MHFKETLKKKYKVSNMDVGFFDSVYENGLSVASVAMKNEYGTNEIPARPFMKNSVKNRKKWIVIVEKAVKQGYTFSDGLSMLAITATGDIKKEITTGAYAPNAPYTVAKKGFSKPLVDTGFMLRSVDWRLV